MFASLLSPLLSGAMPAMRLIDAETAHGLALRALQLGLAGADTARDPATLQIRCLGRLFPNPIGLAAGFDKNAEAVLPLMRLGFGFVGEVAAALDPGCRQLVREERRGECRSVHAGRDVVWRGHQDAPGGSVFARDAGGSDSDDRRPG